MIPAVGPIFAKRTRRDVTGTAVIRAERIDI
jgi:hypothetical protein